VTVTRVRRRRRYRVLPNVVRRRRLSGGPVIGR
jgi:hypothetical protein